VQRRMKLWDVSKDADWGREQTGFSQVSGVNSGKGMIVIRPTGSAPILMSRYTHGDMFRV